MGFNEEFVAWVGRELKSRGWSISALSEASGLPHSTISSVLNGARGPSPHLCNGVAKAFNLPPVDVFVRAGLMEPERKKSGVDLEICHKVTLLTEDQKAILLAAIDGIIAHNQS